MEEKKFYPVFAVNVCVDSFAIDYMLVGAEDESDLIKSLKPLVRNKSDVKKISKERDWRVTRIPNLFTDNPHTVLERYAYYE